jgi:hypothetical protein
VITDSAAIWPEGITILVVPSGHVSVNTTICGTTAALANAVRARKFERLRERVARSETAALRHFDFRPYVRRTNNPWWRDYATPPLYATDEMPQNAIKPEFRRSKSTRADRVHRKRRRFLQKLRAT